jgi:hypothetical protein
MSDIGQPDSPLGEVANEAMQLIEMRLAQQDVTNGQVLVMLTDWEGVSPNSNVSMVGYGDDDEKVAMQLIERLVTAAMSTAERVGYPLRIVEGEMPGILPCNCGHGWMDHSDADGCSHCECKVYHPIPRSEARRREFEDARAAAEAEASERNKSELKSQEFPTEAGPDHRFWVDQQGRYTDASLVNAITPFGIVVGEHPVVDSGRYMTYRTRTGADNGLNRARLELPEARIVEFDGGE